MKGAWIGSLGLSLGIMAGGAGGQEYQWRPARSAAAVSETPSRPAATLGAPVATLGRPVPLLSNTGDRATAGAARASVTDSSIARTSYSPAAIEAPRVVRAQAPEFGAPSLAPPPGVAPIPTSPDERYNCGVVGDPPGAKRGFFGKCKDWCAGIGSGGGAAGGGLFSGLGASDSNRALFQSDHGFDQLASPVSDPFFFEDPRSLTEVRPVFIFQETPGSNWIYKGGDVVWFGTQARVALTERLSLVMNKLGGVWSEPHNHVDGFDSHDGFSEVWLGPKYTFYRCEQTGTVAAAGLTFQIPAGSGRVYQDTGTLTLNPYLSFAQTFGRSSYGSFNFMNTSGLAIATDDKRSDYMYSSFHLDYNVLNANRFYPLIEMNWTHYTEGGNILPIGFEGRDLFNYGSTAVSGRDYLSVALGFRYKFNECIQAGFAIGTPIIAPRDIYGYRITTDLIFRY